MLPFELTKDTPYLALSGELWSVFYEYFNRNWSCYKGFLLYMLSYIINNGNKSNIKPVMLCLFLAAWMVQGVLLRMDQNTLALTLMAKWGNSSG